jgi:hypothetical protein
MALPTTTAHDLITGALTMLGVLGTGQTLEAADATNGLRVLNELVDSWGTQRLTMPFLARTVVPLVSGQASYTIGVGGDIDMPQPAEISYLTRLWPSP